MNPIGWTKYIYLAHFAKPVCDRTIFRAIKKQQISRIVEIGLRDVGFTTSMLQVSLKYGSGDRVSYAGIDLFEARPADQPAFSLKEMHKHLSDDGVKARLIPGEPLTGLARFANTLTGSQLVVISADLATMQEAWFYVPRMLAEDATIFVYNAEGDRPVVSRMSDGDVRDCADRSALAQRRVA